MNELERHAILFGKTYEIPEEHQEQVKEMFEGAEALRAEATALLKKAAKETAHAWNVIREIMPELPDDRHYETRLGMVRDRGSLEGGFYDRFQRKLEEVKRELAARES